jgi:hypothetical protein
MYWPCKRAWRGEALSGQPLASSASRRFVAALDSFIARHEVPLVRFHKSQRKDEMMPERLGSFAATEGVFVLANT